MKTRLRSSILRGTVLATLVATLFSSVSCMTTYDAYGRPQQTVDPGMAVAGVAAAGVLGYALADGGGRRDHHHHYERPRYRGHGGHYGHRRY